MKPFPDCSCTWDQLVRGKTVEAVLPLKEQTGSPRSFAPMDRSSWRPSRRAEPYELGEALPSRPGVPENPRRPMPGTTGLRKKTKMRTRTARLENILGAIQNNVEQIPELKTGSHSWSRSGSEQSPAKTCSRSFSQGLFEGE